MLPITINVKPVHSVFIVNIVNIVNISIQHHNHKWHNKRQNLSANVGSKQTNDDDDLKNVDDDDGDKGTGVLDQYQCHVSRPSCGNRPLTSSSKQNDNYYEKYTFLQTWQHSQKLELKYLVLDQVCLLIALFNITSVTLTAKMYLQVIIQCDSTTAACQRIHRSKLCLLKLILLNGSRKIINFITYHIDQ